MALKPLTGLKKLDLSFNELTDNFIIAVTALAQLGSIDLRETSVTDGPLETL